MFDDQNWLNSVNAIATDVTARKNLYSDIERMFNALEQRRAG